MPATKVLVTGATGFIAGHAIGELLTNGYAVRGTVRRRSVGTAHLDELASAAGESLEFAEAALERDEGWDDAVAGCDYVWHLASPVPVRAPKHEQEVVRPAVDGTVRVLEAAARSGTVRRVVLASSLDAIIHGHDEPGRTCSEEDWSVPERCAPYPKSKVLAERAAWDFVADQPLELAVVNGGLALGPLLRPQPPASMEVIRLLLAHKLPAVPPMSFAITDARDLARAFRLAMETPEAAGNRYITANDGMWLGDVARLLKDRFGSRGYRVPVRRMPYWLMWANARFDATIRLALTYYGIPASITADKARRELGWAPRDPARRLSPPATA